MRQPKYSRDYMLHLIDMTKENWDDIDLRFEVMRALRVGEKAAARTIKRALMIGKLMGRGLDYESAHSKAVHKYDAK